MDHDPDAGDVPRGRSGGSVSTKIVDGDHVMKTFDDEVSVTTMAGLAMTVRRLKTSLVAAMCPFRAYEVMWIMHMLLVDVLDSGGSCCA